ncbi:hypothetical protein SAMN02745126_01236 [Enhydrobacter aerosaccus]|uniref:Uncharacterized protein n=1 Tax=Enhydrobacter aerosaccus TaxID=225324 RepID=A0A1T4KYG1_9HYPH|nr:hypothetical protein [Enhydrobacter aerosaccus]SJZ47494.1 hypothetical protein SAMN02745126_01236 [Enhydrobacter aerosaccus]
MARSSHGSRRATTWAVAQKPKPMPRVVRLGRPANDNVRQTGLQTRLLVVAIATALMMVMLYDWRLI